jgi:Recombination endonuclease VII
MKTCTKCGLSKDLSDFHKDKTRKTGFRDICKMCAKIHRTEWYNRNEGSIRAKNNVSSKQRYHSDPKRAKGESLRKYWPHLSWQESLSNYEGFLKAQNNTCAICENPETSEYRNGKIKDLSVDHNHITGEVRGLLCNACNKAIGSLLADSGTELFVKAINYLENRNS